MALIQCEECGHQVSNRAVSCPSCGYPMIDVASEPVIVESRPSAQPSPSLAKTVTSRPVIYTVAFGMGIASLFLGGTFGLVAWATVAVSLWALYSTRIPSRRWMAWTGLALGVLFSFMNAYLNGHLDALVSTDPPTAIAVEIPTDETANLGGNKYAFIANWVAMADGDPQVTPKDPQPGRMGDSEVWTFDDPGSLYISPSAGRPMESLYLSYNPASTELSVFLARWDHLCWSLPIGPIDRVEYGPCLEETMAGLGVSDDPNSSIWQRNYEAEHIYANYCWQIKVNAAIDDILPISARLSVDAAASPDSACRR